MQEDWKQDGSKNSLEEIRPEGLLPEEGKEQFAPLSSRKAGIVLLPSLALSVYDPIPKVSW
jgi:hypothetical protein